MEEKITVVIPVYNVEAYLKQCLDSITKQTYQNLEILAVNDGSSDASAEILQEYAEKDSRIQVLNKENGGLSDARNYGIAHSTGKYICFIDGDDWIKPEYIEKLYQAIQSKDAEIAVCDMEYCYEDGRKEFSAGGSFSHTNVQIWPELIRINNSACNKLYKTELFDSLLFPKGKLYEDLATVPILLYESKLVSKVNEPLYEYRQRAGSIRHDHASEKIFDLYDAIDRVKQYVLDHGKEPEVLEEINHMYVIYGLDLLTLRIKDFDEKEVRADYLKRNLEELKKRYPEYQKDPFVKNAGMKKKMIYHLLAKGKMSTVLKIYDR